ncbi:trigger factor [Pseudoclavibacter endophyticus]|uniref:Trigger factor n=1 Tax=Pseudoclavibacter endophyticus TaxID=1778590 RepID=A0A6H9WJ43_9MICO|nr:trigger factor [Pseudoclavibacter endophyticus]KAB1646736.1 trigger factor [Pseudoclavibacter endophyticus]GGA75991.1 trigger factor [Pseudoclavibacter endophyticus]
MKTSVEQINPTHVKLTIAVEPAELQPYLDGAYKTISSQIQVPGFRRGKVPAAIIDQRVGKEAVIEQAVSDGLDTFYNQAVTESGIQPLGRPQADVSSTPTPAGREIEGDLVIDVEVDVRPEFELPDYRGLKLKVDAAEVTDEDVDAEIQELRKRFGTLVTVDRPIEDGDFVTLDLVAAVDGEQVDEAKGISYELGSGQLLEGTDEALLTLTAGETTTFSSTLLGGEREGEDAEITVTVEAVKVRELPELDDDFAQMASEFDTVEELRDDLRTTAASKKTFEQVDQAREQIVPALLERVDIAVPQQVVEDEVARHLQAEGKDVDDPHAEEVRAETEKSFRQQVLLDAIIKEANIQVEQDELTQFMIQSASQYGMQPQEFVNMLQENGQFMGMVGEVARSKALLFVLDKAEVVDENGDPVDVSEFTVAIRRAEEKAAADAAAEAVPTDELVGAEDESDAAEADSDEAADDATAEADDK